MHVQESLFAAAADRPGPLGEGHRIQLDATSWVDLHHAAVPNAGGLFVDLLTRLEWRPGRRVLFDREVDEPRLHATLHDPRRDRRIAGLADALTARYGRAFDTLFINRYRDGRDSVAWHRDRIHRHQAQPLVAVLTLGAARRFLLRPYGGGPSVRLRPGPGDLLVMGGRSQHDHEHSVPKTARAVGERISVTLRPSADG